MNKLLVASGAVFAAGLGIYALTRSAEAAPVPPPVTFTLRYTAGSNGNLGGDANQIVAQGHSGTPVVAMPNSGYHFKNWSDGSVDNPRTDVAVIANISVSAIFEVDTVNSSQGVVTYTALNIGEVPIVGASASQPVKDAALAAGGYVATGTNDQTVINTAKRAAMATGHSFTLKLVGDFFISDSVDFTALNSNWTIITAMDINLTGAVINAMPSFMNGHPMVDMTGSQYVKFTGGLISNRTTAVPSCGILTARGPNTNWSDPITSPYLSGCSNFFEGVHVWGKMGKACVYLCASEGASYNNCVFINYSPGGYCIVLTTTNKFGVASPFINILQGYNSCSADSFLGCETENADNDGTPAGTVYIEGNATGFPNNTTFVGSFYETKGRTVFEFDCSSGPVTGVTIDGIIAADVNKTNFIWSHGGTSRGISVTGCSYSANTPFDVDSADEWFAAGNHNVSGGASRFGTTPTNSFIRDRGYNVG